MSFEQLTLQVHLLMARWVMPSLICACLVLHPSQAAEPSAQVVHSAPHSLPQAPALPLRDPLEQLRERLAVKLGAVKARDTSLDADVMRVISKTSEVSPSTATADLEIRPRAPRRASSVKKPTNDKPAGQHVSHSDWSYEGTNGPNAWGQMSPEFGLCASGARQSPIDIRDGIGVDLEPLAFDYRPTKAQVLDTGHTIQVNFDGGNFLDVMGRHFELEQIHFHRPSEERINGRQFDMVLHMVHKDANGRLAIVAVLIESGPAHAGAQTIWNNIPLEKREALAVHDMLDPKDFLPVEHKYFIYMGSLTTPPCTEGVLWMVLKQPIQLSSEQISLFARLYPMNARPIQAAFGRLIKESR